MCFIRASRLPEVFHQERIDAGSVLDAGAVRRVGDLNEARARDLSGHGAAHFGSRDAILRRAYH